MKVDIDSLVFDDGSPVQYVDRQGRPRPTPKPQPLQIGRQRFDRRDLAYLREADREEIIGLLPRE